VPAGGTTNQVLTKSSGTDYASNWATPITPGLVPIIPTSVTTVSGSASINTTTGVITVTGAGTVNVNGAFSATYNHYRILHVSSGASANTGIGMQMRAAGVNYTTANQRSHVIYYSSSGSPTIGGGGDALSTINIGWIQGTANSLNAISIDMYNPFNATQTTYNSQFTSYVSGTAGGGVPTTTQYDGFSLQITGTYSGTIEIYGYH
jgi:hypothetical protein